MTRSEAACLLPNNLDARALAHGTRHLGSIAYLGIGEQDSNPRFQFRGYPTLAVLRKPVLCTDWCVGSSSPSHSSLSLPCHVSSHGRAGEIPLPYSPLSSGWYNFPVFPHPHFFHGAKGAHYIFALALELQNSEWIQNNIPPHFLLKSRMQGSYGWKKNKPKGVWLCGLTACHTSGESLEMWILQLGLFLSFY